MSKGLNSTFIALIPKVDCPQRLNDLRPISLVGSLYKILAKVLANRLRLMIGSVISESKIAFVKDRQILDGILIANEAVDEAPSVLVNDSPTDEFPLERGLRQGDSLSPFLFLLAAEGLNVMMQAMVENQLFSGYSIGNQNLIVVFHLQFADDTLLLGTKSWANVRALRVVLVLFETMSGLKVNFNKSMLVGVNIVDSWLHAAASAMHCKVGKVPLPGTTYWWGIERIRDGVDDICGGWFGESVMRKVGDGTKTFFWTDTWLDETHLCIRFRRLFDLAVHKSNTVAEMFYLGWGTIGEAWEWRRQLWAWEEEMLGECQNLLHDFFLQAQYPDSWHWRPDPTRGFSVRGAYQLLTSQPS
ncbi:hypothetical protein TSUD_69120 [Trifolium subterraneum]|uniref:Reverse transcriptase domain-containing protein n=1 Tax=Trifolium subterraneum TaxID=3900 RepID=A0A2Z6N4P1_TRISU|nr:hypothetical protein TSUD_69120 [Trifolium subterraneum]